MRKFAWLLAGTLGFWAAITFAASRIWGDSVWLPSAVACCLCLAPASATLIWINSAGDVSPEKQLLMVFGGTGIRLLVVLGLGMAIFLGYRDYFPLTFWVWVGIFYIFTLSLEVLLLSRQPTQEP